MLQQCKKTLNYETTNQDNSVYSFLEKE
jgi:hypothetical protein